MPTQYSTRVATLRLLNDDVNEMYFVLEILLCKPLFYVVMIKSSPTYHGYHTYEDWCARSVYQWQGQVITASSIVCSVLLTAAITINSSRLSDAYMRR